MTSRLRKAKLIFECFVEVSRPSETEEAQIRSIYPKDFEWDDDTKKQLPKFTFPTRSSNESEEHFTFVLTDLDSQYRFGFCRYPPKGETCLCFLSDLPWYKVFYRALDKISDLRLNHQHEVVEPFLAGLRSHPIPTLGIDTVLSVVPEGVDTGQVYTFPLPNPKRLPEIPTDDNLTQFYTNLHYNVILHLFSNLIFERRIIITSSSLSLLSAAVHGAVMLLYPLHWQHIFIPITPPHLLDYCAAPMPFLMGIHSSYMDSVRKMPIEDVVVLDVDESAIESPHVEDLETLPIDVVSSLKHILRKQSSAYGDTVTRSFLRAQVSMIGGYRSALKLRQGEKEVVFDEDQFLKSRPNSEEFLESLLHFQHFRQFINSKIEKLKTKNQERDRFDDEVMMYEEEISGADQLKAGWDKFISQTLGKSKKWGDKLKEGSEKLGGKMHKQAKIADKSLKNMMKKLSDQKYSNYQTSQAALLQDQSPFNHGRTNSLPMHKSASESVLQRPTIMTPPPTVHPHSQSVKLHPRKPPPVIPYKRHVEGKQKLADILRIQSTTSDPTVGTLVNFTPPGTPRSVASAEHSERASLDSRCSAEASVTSVGAAPGEVAIGNLIDITSLANAPVTPPSDSSSDSDSIISTTSSSGTSADNEQDSKPIQQWETFEESDIQEQEVKPASLSDRPRLPPPRSAIQLSNDSHSHDSLRNNSLTPVDLPIDSPPNGGNPFLEFETDGDPAAIESELTFNTVESSLDKEGVLRPSSGMGERENDLVRPSSPFESLHLNHPDRPVSPFDDFSSSIARTLLDSSQRLSPDDPRAANTLANTSQELFKTSDDEGDLIMVNKAAEPETITPESTLDLLAMTTPGLSTQNVNTELPRSSALVHLKNDSATTSNAHNVHVSSSAPNLLPAQVPQNSVHTMSGNMHANAYFRGYQNSKYDSRQLRRPSGPRSPKFAQHIPLSFPQVPLISHGSSSKRPPTRPQPYSGAQVSQFREQFQKGHSTNKTDSLMDPMLQRLPSLGSFNPFGDLLGDGGMEAYVSGPSSSKETPIV